VNTRYRRKQVAIRQLLLDTRGNLNANGRVAAAEFKRVRGKAIMQYDHNGAVDPIGTAAAAARWEMWEHFVRLLHLEPYEAANLREEEQ